MGGSTLCMTPASLKRWTCALRVNLCVPPRKAVACAKGMFLFTDTGMFTWRNEIETPRHRNQLLGSRGTQTRSLGVLSLGIRVSFWAADESAHTLRMPTRTGAQRGVLGVKIDFWGEVLSLGVSGVTLSFWAVI